MKEETGVEAPPKEEDMREYLEEVLAEIHNANNKIKWTGQKLVWTAMTKQQMEARLSSPLAFHTCTTSQLLYFALIYPLVSKKLFNVINCSSVIP
jgi:hypothetical protein